MEKIEPSGMPCKAQGPFRPGPAAPGQIAIFRVVRESESSAGIGMVSGNLRRTELACHLEGTDGPVTTVVDACRCSEIGAPEIDRRKRVCPGNSDCQRWVYRAPTEIVEFE